MSAAVTGAAVGAAACMVATPYLARLAIHAPDRADTTWWRATRSPSRHLLLVVALSGVGLGALAGAAARWSAVLPAFVWLALLGTPLVVIDYDLHRLPNRLVVPAAAGGAVLLAVAAAVQHAGTSLLRAAEAAVAVFVVLLVLNVISPRSFGFGDVKLGGVLGGYLGWFGWVHVYDGIFAGFLLGALLSIALLASRRATMKTAIAFGPMLIVGALLVLAVAHFRSST